MIYYRLGSSQLAEQILEDDTRQCKNYTNQNLKIEKNSKSPYAYTSFDKQKQFNEILS